MRATLALSIGRPDDYMRRGEVVLSAERAKTSVFMVDRRREEEKVRKETEDTEERKRIGELYTVLANYYEVLAQPSWSTTSNTSRTKVIRSSTI